MGISGNEKGRESTNTGHALMHVLTWEYIRIAHTKASIEGIPPKNINTDIIWKQIMSRLITRVHAQYNMSRTKTLDSLDPSPNGTCLN